MPLSDNKNSSLIGQFDINSGIYDNFSKLDQEVSDSLHNSGNIDAYNLWIYCSPFLLVLGTVGNVLSYIVLQRKALRRGTCALYLRAIAVSDMGKLYFGLFPNWIGHMFEWDITAQNSFLCKFRNFTFYTFADIAVWFLVMFSLDRFLAICLPLRKDWICTKKRAYISIAIISSIAIGKNAHIFWTRDLVSIVDPETNETITICQNPDPDHRYFNMYVRPWIVFITVNVIPFVVISICNILIVKSLVTRHKDCIKVSNKKENDMIQMAITCCAVSFTFLLLVTPSMILLIGQPYWRATSASESKYELAKAFGNLFIYLNHSINILLYTLTGQRFRKELIYTLSCTKRSKTTFTRAPTLYQKESLEENRCRSISFSKTESSRM